MDGHSPPQPGRGFFLKGKFAQKGIPGHRDGIPCCGDVGYVLANRRSIESGHPSN